MSAIVTLPFSLKAQHEGGHEGQPTSSGYFVSEDSGDGQRIHRPVTQDDIDQAQARREKAQKDQRAQRNSEASGYSGFFSPESWTNGAGESGAYTAGSITLNPENVKAQKQNMMSDGLSQMGAIGQSASSLTKDPKTAGVVMATASGLGAASSLVNAAAYGNLAGQYAEVEMRNDEAAHNNNLEIGRMKTAQQTLINKMNTLNPQDSQRIKFEAQAKTLSSQIENAQAERKIQKAAEKQANRNAWGNKLGMYASILTGAALGYMGERQYDMSRQMANDQKACKRDPTKCVGYIPPRPTSDNRPLPVPPDTRPTGPEGFDPNRLPKSTPVSDTSKGATATNTGSSSNRSGRAPELLSSSGLLGKASPLGEKSDSDFGGGYSADQSFGSSSGGSGSGRESAGSSASLGSSSSGDDGNFDISQFIPGWMKDQQVPTDENGFLVAQHITSAKNETKGLLLGKNSPSLFTRVSQAYQKKAHELKEEVL